ncbi:hypothetical protein D3C73_1124510 [compost metagenome]
MLQSLELAYHLAELLAGLEVVQRQTAHRLHAADCFGALGGDCPALLITQRRQRLAHFTEQRSAADHHVVQVQLAGLATIHGREGTTADARRVRVEQKQTDAGFVALGAGGTRGHQDHSSTVPGHHHRFTSVELPAAVDSFGAGAYVVQLVVTGRLVDGDGQLQLCTGHLRQQFAALFVIAQLAEQATGKND